ncbi:MAG: hypothetical protein IKH65_07580 [Clostridia bacterium]|nr:hypothetical protein [Clostridia bacterium]
MKKAICLLLTLAAVLSLAACTKTVYFDEKEYSEAVAKSEKEESESISQQEEEREKDVKNVEKELGKTEKNKKIIAKLAYGDHFEYEAVYFDKDGLAEYKLTYKYFDTDDYYQMVLGYGDVGDDKLIQSDDEIRCLVYKNKNIMKSDFETMYELYQRKSEDICTVYE